MKQIELVIQNQTGLHARPAKVLVNLAKQFKSNISLQHGSRKANAKSMVSVLTLGAVCGSDITVQADGVDEEKALVEIEAAIRAGLGDPDTHVEPQPAPSPAPSGRPSLV
jgi:phosphocarrier protein FPr